MRRSAAIAIVVAISAATASATIYTTAAQGALQMELNVDPLGNAWLTNITAAPVDVDGYSIWSTDGNLSPSEHCRCGRG